MFRSRILLMLFACGALSAAGPDATLDEMAAALEEFIKGGGAAAPQGGQGAQAKAGCS